MREWGLTSSNSSKFLYYTWISSKFHPCIGGRISPQHMRVKCMGAQTSDDGDRYSASISGRGKHNPSHFCQNWLSKVSTHLIVKIMQARIPILVAWLLSSDKVKLATQLITLKTRLQPHVVPLVPYDINLRISTCDSVTKTGFLRIHWNQSLCNRFFSRPWDYC